jgi:colicin import membrane protein
MPIITETGIDMTAWNSLRLRQSKELAEARDVVNKANAALQAVLLRHKAEAAEESRRQSDSMNEQFEARQKLAKIAQQEIAEQRKIAAVAAQAAKKAQAAAKQAEIQAKRAAQVAASKAVVAAEAHRKSVVEGQAQAIRDKMALRRQERTAEATARRNLSLTQSSPA